MNDSAKRRRCISADELLGHLLKYMQLCLRLENERKTVSSERDESPGFVDELDFHYEAQIALTRDRMRECLIEYQRYPPYHDRHERFVDRFHQDAQTDYEKCVFIMTKYPSPTHSESEKLANVIRTVQEAVREHGFCPRLASESNYHSSLWDNVELYLLGCSLGIAIVEDRFGAQLNPNVAMEWGWMRGAGKEVLFLIDEGYKRQPADWQGLLYSEFSWDTPQPAINKAVGGWLQLKSRQLAKPRPNPYV